MNYSEYVKAEQELKGQLARRDRRMYLVRETVFYAGAMALVLTLSDATPWPLGDQRPLARLVFIVLWAVAMAYWQLRRVRSSVAGTQPAA